MLPHVPFKLKHTRSKHALRHLTPLLLLKKCVLASNWQQLISECPNPRLDRSIAIKLMVFFNSLEESFADCHHFAFVPQKTEEII